MIQQLPNRTFSTIALTTCLSILANAAQAFTFSSSGEFDNPVGGSSISYPTVGGENQVRWGLPAFPSSNSSNSGLGYTGTTGTADFGKVFILGTLRHFNNPILSGAAQSVDLSIDLNFGGDIPSFSQSFNFTLDIDETPNSGQCAYPGSTICPDKISWASLTSTNSFEFENTTYTLELLGFSTTVDGTPINEFISDEGATNAAYLFGRVVERNNAAVPEPTTMLGLALAGAGMTYMRRRQKNAS